MISIAVVAHPRGKKHCRLSKRQNVRVRNRVTPHLIGLTSCVFPLAMCNGNSVWEGSFLFAYIGEAQYTVATKGGGSLWLIANHIETNWVIYVIARMARTVQLIRLHYFFVFATSSDFQKVFKVHQIKHLSVAQLSGNVWSCKHTSGDKFSEALISLLTAGGKRISSTCGSHFVSVFSQVHVNTQTRARHSYQFSYSNV